MIFLLSFLLFYYQQNQISISIERNDKRIFRSYVRGVEMTERKDRRKSYLNLLRLFAYLALAFRISCSYDQNHRTYRVLSADVETKLDPAVCAAPGRSTPASPNRRVAAEWDDRPDAWRCRSLWDEVAGVRRVPEYAAPSSSWWPVACRCVASA